MTQLETSLHVLLCNTVATNPSLYMTLPCRDQPVPLRDTAGDSLSMTLPETKPTLSVRDRLVSDCSGEGGVSVVDRDGLASDCVRERDWVVSSCVTERDGLVSDCVAEREELVSDCVADRDRLVSDCVMPTRPGNNLSGSSESRRARTVMDPRTPPQRTEDDLKTRHWSRSNSHIKRVLE